MKPLLAHIYEPHRVTYPCYVQPKLNGIRALWGRNDKGTTSFLSRDGHVFAETLLAHLDAPLRETFGTSIVLDGELYVHGWPLQRINAAVTPVRQRPTEDTVLVEYHVFDVVDFGRSFEARLSETCLAPELLQTEFVTTRKATDETMANQHYADWVSLGYEGMMYRLGDCPYTVPKMERGQLSWAALNNLPGSSRFLSDKDNRCWHLLKRKDWRDDEFRCVGVQEGEGKYQGTLGALQCSSFKTDKTKVFELCEPALHPTFSVGSGLTDSQRAHYWANPPIGKLIKVKYLVLSSDGIPLNPTVHPDHIL